MKGSEIRKIRKQLGLTQGELAERVGVHRITVTNWERGKKRVQEPTARLIRLLPQLDAKGRAKRKRGR